MRWESQFGDPFTYHLAGPDAERTAFWFNLTTGIKQDEKKRSNPSGNPVAGQYQTANYAYWGPVFGPSFWFPDAHDLYVAPNLESGWASQFGYGDYFASADIVSGQAVTSFNVDSLEVFTIAAGDPVPEPATLMLLGSGVAGLVAHRRRTTR